MMHLTESQARRIAQSYVNSDALGQMLSDALGRPVTEGEAEDLLTACAYKLGDILADFEFTEEEDVPKLDRYELWAEEHAGMTFRRPKGKVMYTVTGQVEYNRYGLRGTCFPLVVRSSDGKTQPMSIGELKAMEIVDG